MRPVTGSSVERENRRPSRSWASPTTVGSGTRPKPSPSGGSRRKSGWLRSSKPSRLSFNAGCMIAWSKSVHGFGRLYLGYYHYHAVPGNIDQLRIFKHRVHRLWRSVLVRRSQRAKKKWEKYDSGLRQMDTNTPHPASLSRCPLLRHSSFVRAVCVNAHVRICPGGAQR